VLNVRRKKRLKLIWFPIVLLCWWLHSWFCGLSGIEIKNSGVSFGWSGWLVVILNLGLLLVLSWFGWVKNNFGVGIVLVGGWVNMIDRIVFGYVRDYWWLGPVYNNIADWIISVGVIIFVWKIWKQK
jgi:lipoprotein signal peptidase